MDRMDCTCDISGCRVECECTCEMCQDNFVENWGKIVKRFGLCYDCGVPLELNPKNLLEHQHVHFFDPCEKCEVKFQVCMAMAKLCEVCHSYVDACKCD